MISSALHGTKKRLKISVFQSIRYTGFYESVSRPISNNKNRFYTNDLPAEGTSNPYLDFSLLTSLDV